MNPGDLQYPSSVSRTLLADSKALIRVIAQHDRQLADADLNLVQDLTAIRTQKRLADQTTSGCLTYSPIMFTPQISNSFTIPAFDVLLNGEAVTIAGNLSTNLALNRVVIPQPQTWQLGQTSQPAQIFIVFLEMWYASVDVLTGQGYYTDPVSGQYYYYPFGCVTPDPSNLEILPSDVVDPFTGLVTTLRAKSNGAYGSSPSRSATIFLSTASDWTRREHVRDRLCSRRKFFPRHRQPHLPVYKYGHCKRRHRSLESRRWKCKQ